MANIRNSSICSFSQAAQAAGDALGIVDPRKQLDAAGLAVTRTRTALAAYTLPDSGLSAKETFRSIDAAFMGLYELFFEMRTSADPSVSGFASDVQAAMTALNDQFSRSGWKVPQSDAEGHLRAKAAKQAGASTLTTTEKATLGRLHLRAARQQILGSWEDVTRGRLEDAKLAAHNLADAMAIFVDPRLANEIEGATADINQTDQIFSRLALQIEQHHPERMAELRDLAREMDGLLRLIGADPRWLARFTKSAPATAGAQGPAMQPSSAPGSMPPMISNEVDRGAPRAEPAMHRIGEIRNWTRKVHIKDTNYVNEYLGYVELFIEAYKSPSGQVYVQRAKATDHLQGAGNQYLSIGADIIANSIDLNGERFSDVFFDVQVGGPNKTETRTTAFTANAGVAAGTKESGASAGVGATVTFSTAVSSHGTRSFRRVFRISSLGKPMQVLQADGATGKLELVDSGMLLTERSDLHQDFANFVLDDGEIGRDGWLSTETDWILHSHD